MEVHLVATDDKLYTQISSGNILQPNDLLLFMGAGTITKWAYNFYERLVKDQPKILA